MMQRIKTMLGLSAQKDAAADREINVLRSRLTVERLGLRRAGILLRTQLMDELIEGPERPPK